MHLLLLLLRGRVYSLPYSISCRVVSCRAVARVNGCEAQRMMEHLSVRESCRVVSEWGTSRMQAAVYGAACCGVASLHQHPTFFITQHISQRRVACVRACCYVAQPPSRLNTYTKCALQLQIDGHGCAQSQLRCWRRRRRPRCERLKLKHALGRTVGRSVVRTDEG